MIDSSRARSHRQRRSLRLFLIALVVGIGLLDVWWYRHWLMWQLWGDSSLFVSADVKRRRAELLEELRPVSLSNCELARMGGPNDGGYLMCRNLLAGTQTAYSYGINTEDKWGCDVSVALGVPVHQYDCFHPTALACEGGTFRLKAECVGPRAETVDGRRFDTLENQITGNGDSAKRIVMKMDVEGAEWQSLLTAPDAVLDSIDQMAMELHGVDDPVVLEGLRKLKRHFHLVSVHFNNHACNRGYFSPLPAWAYQVLLVNKRVGVVGNRPDGSAAPESLMAPDAPWAEDCQLVR